MLGSPEIRALLVEDDARLADLTRSYLQRHGVHVAISPDGVRALEEASSQTFDVVLLDLMIPGRNGIDVCRRLRETSDVPIIMVTARNEEADRVLGLEVGADDYVPKPFSPRELLARIQAIVRRARGNAGPGPKMIHAGDLVLDTGSRTVQLDNKPIELTSYEFALLSALAERGGRVLGREQLIELAGGSAEESFDRSIDVHISRLRQKLGDNPRRPTRIKTIRGMGYQYVSPPSEDK